MEYSPANSSVHENDVCLHFTIIDSTNSWAKRNADNLDPKKLTLITANEQTGGRGRFQRRWHSPAGLNIYATFCFFVSKLKADSGNIALVMGITAAQALQEFGFQPKLKWPNDVLISGRKVAGILCETTQTAHGIAFIVGIGIDINMPKEHLEKIDQPATSLMIEADKEFSISEVTNILHAKFKANLALFFDHGFQPFIDPYRDLGAYSVGQPLVFHLHTQEWKGTFHKIESDGTFSLKLPSGEIKTFSAGEISF